MKKLLAQVVNNFRLIRPEKFDSVFYRSMREGRLRFLVCVAVCLLMGGTVVFPALQPYLTWKEMVLTFWCQASAMSILLNVWWNYISMQYTVSHYMVASKCAMEAAEMGLVDVEINNLELYLSKTRKARTEAAKEPAVD